MKFCSQCGKTLSILDIDSTNLCLQCNKASTTTSTSQDSEQKNTIPPDILNTTVTFKENKIILESPEGWLLWSGDGSNPHPLHLIISRAEKILAIRKRQKK